MKKYIGFLCCLFAAVGSAFAGSTSECPTGGCDGSSYKDNSGVNHTYGDPNIQQYLSGDTKNAFVVNFKDETNGGKFHGKAVCSNTTGTWNNDGVSSESNVSEDNDGKNCWCQLDSDLQSIAKRKPISLSQKWLYVIDFDDASACKEQCALMCASSMCLDDASDKMTKLLIEAGLCDNKEFEQEQGGGGQTPGPCDSYEAGSEARACCDKANQENPETKKDFEIESDNKTVKVCNCVDDTKQWNGTNKTCEPKPTGGDEGGEEQSSGPCKDYPAGSEARECCEKAQGENAVTDMVLDTDGKTFKSCECKPEQGTWNPETKTCEKNQGGTENTPGEQTTDDCEYTFSAQFKCKDGTNGGYTNKLTLSKSLFADGCQDGNINQDFYDWLKVQTDKVKEEVKRTCNAVKTKLEQDAKKEAEAEIQKQHVESAKKDVQSFINSASNKASKWKDAEGNFNTARLASDLTAGVVLGTVGGVVSGVVIKKKQIEKGFEVLHCDVGGQKMADWGDTFTIGLKRY